MRLVNQSQRSNRVIATVQRRVHFALSTTMGLLMDLLKASLGTSSKRAGNRNPSPSWQTMVFDMREYGNCMRAIHRPAYAINHRAPSTPRTGQ